MRFAQYLLEFREHFAAIAVLIHGWDWEMGVHSIYEKCGLTALRGAKKSDPQSLDKVVRLFRSHETVVSNYLGSPIAYAAYLGARVAVVGEPPEPDLRAIFRAKLTRNCIESAIVSVRWESAWRHRRELDFLLRDPSDAVTAVEWGRFEVGADQRRTPEEIGHLFGGTDPGHEAASRRRLHRAAVAAVVPASRLARSARGTLVERIPPRARIALRASRTAASMLLGQMAGKDRITLVADRAADPFAVSADAEDLTTAADALVRDPLGSLADLIGSVDMIIEVGAYRGYSTQRFRALNRHADIVAIEPRSDHVTSLTENVARLGEVRVVRAALWTESGMVELSETGTGGPGTTVLKGQWAEGAPIHRAPTVTWEELRRDLLPERRKTLLYLDIEGAEGAILRASGASMFASCHACIISVREHEGVAEDVLMGLMDAYGTVRFEMREERHLLVIERTGEDRRG